MTGPSRTAREARRYRSGQSPDRLRGRIRNGEGGSGHPALFAMRPAIELGTFPSGGGYPHGFVEAAAQLMGVDLAAIVHLCSGSVRGGRLTIDIRRSAGADVVADVRWLPLRPRSVTAILADPPYSPEYADQLWGTAKVYPTPTVLLRECAEVLAPGGVVAVLHHLMPDAVPGLVRMGCYGVTTGPGYRIRALTLFRRQAQPLFEIDSPAALCDPGA